MRSSLQKIYEWLPLLPLLALLLATYWLYQQVRPLPPKVDSSQRHDPDIIIHDFSALTLDQYGAPRFRLAASQLMHYPDDDSTHLQAPRLSSLYPDRPPVYTSALRGEISSGGDEIFLREKVKIVRASDNTQGERVFTTEYLHIIPERDLAQTDQAVTIMDAHNTMHAVGMRFDNKTRVVQLLTQVRVQHENTKAP